MAEYEEVVYAFLLRMPGRVAPQSFLEAFAPFQARIPKLGAINGLRQARLN